MNGYDIADEEGIIESIPPSNHTNLQELPQENGLHCTSNRAGQRQSPQTEYGLPPCRQTEYGLFFSSEIHTVQSYSCKRAKADEEPHHEIPAKSLSYSTEPTVPLENGFQPTSESDCKPTNTFQIISESDYKPTNTFQPLSESCDYKATSTENWTLMHSDAFQSLKSKVTTWRTMRNDSAQARYQDVARLGCLQLAVGVILFTIAMSLRSFHQNAHCFILAISGLLMTIGWTTISTTPPAQMDLDLFPDKHKKTFCIFASGCALMGVLQSMTPPHAHIIPLMVAISEAGRFDKCLPSGWWPLHTSVCSLWICVQKASNAAANVYTFLASCSGVQIFYEDCKPGMLLYLISGLADAGAVLLLSALIPYLRLYVPSIPPTLIVYGLAYFHLTTMGLQAILGGLWVLSESEKTSDQILNGYSLLSYGLLVSLPVVVVCVVGRHTFFNCVARRFEMARSRQDGAFIAELLDNFSVGKGATWWVHHGRNDPGYGEFDPRRNWDRGMVTEVGDHEFVVSVRYGTSRTSPALHRVFLPNRGSSADELLRMADLSLRCVDFISLERHWEELFSTQGTQSRSACFAWSRNVSAGERIDFFMSHSWHDHGISKWRKVQFCARNFNKRQHRYPTFWIDCVCIEQSKIADGLRVLPLYLMACDSVLILCGPTYPTRLWCAWELFTLVTLVNNAAELVHFMPALDSSIGTVSDLSMSTCSDSSAREGSFKETEILRSFENFDLRNAHCYDPNEECRILRVIRSLGIRVFHSRIRALARQLAQRHSATPTLYRFRSTSSME